MLELGAGGRSQVGLFFNDESNTITFSAYPEASHTDLRTIIAEKKNDPRLVSKTDVSLVSAFDCSGTYDVIIWKSVLGGLFRTDTSTLEQVSELVEKLVSNNLNPNGYLVTLDNGESLFEPFVQNFGARRFSWRFFKKGELQNASAQQCFGTFSFYSLGTRFGKTGFMLENILYAVDLLIHLSIGSRKPTVIVTIFENPHVMCTVRFCRIDSSKWILLRNIRRFSLVFLVFYLCG